MTPPAAGATRSLDRKAPANPRRVSARTARRVSGPARPPARPSARASSAGASRSVAAVALPAPGIAPPRRRPTRTGAPARRRARGASAQDPGIALRTAGALERVSASALLDRLIRGRLWIGLLAFALIGIVAMQLVVLKLNTGIGGKLQREALLQRENAELGIENSVYSAENRIAPLAAATGMTFAPAGTVHFVTASPDDFSRAARALSSAAQPYTSTQSGAAGEAAASSSTTSEGTATPAEASGSSSSSSSGAESASGSSETSPAANAEAGTAASSAVPSTAAPASAATSTSGTDEQASGASATPAGGASAPAGDAQAAPQG
jgi:hypothetical protein